MVNYFLNFLFFISPIFFPLAPLDIFRSIYSQPFAVLGYFFLQSFVTCLISIANPITT